MFALGESCQETEAQTNDQADSLSRAGTILALIIVGCHVSHK
jgi:hypothetical protein